MLKIAALLFNTFALLIYQLLFTDAVTITQNIPSSAKPETEFNVEITINKGSNGGFAKLQQELPVGFSAIPDKNNGAAFTFNNQSVKFIWMSLPSEKEFKISYKIFVAAGVSGDKSIAGKFSFVSDNVKQTVEITPAQITIDSTESSPTVVTKTPEKEVTPTITPQAEVPPVAITPPPAPPSEAKSEIKTETMESDSLNEFQNINCFRKTVDNTKSPSEFSVEVTIRKDNLGGFAKFIETLPAGFSATVTESQGATFSFIDHKAKFVWGTLPTQAEFNVSYKVSVAPNISGDQIIEGAFSFIDNDQTKKFILPQTTIRIGEPIAEQSMAVAPKQTEVIKETIAPTPVEYAPKTTEPVATAPVTPTPVEYAPKITEPVATAPITSTPVEYAPKTTEPVATAPVTPTPVEYAPKTNEPVATAPITPTPIVAVPITPEPIAAAPVIPAPKETEPIAVEPPVVTIPVTPSITETTASETLKTKPDVTEKAEEKVVKELSANTIPSPQGNVNYKVQILALKKYKAVDTIAAFFQINEPIETEMGEGFRKYTVGKHNEYKAAHDAREQIPKTVIAPFVTAYNQGKRITVQEALMITNQKWYR